MAHTDHLLIERMQRRDISAMAELYDGSGPALFGIVLRVLHGDEDAAEQVFQRAFVSIWNQAAMYDRAKGSPFFWMMTLVRATALEHLHASGRLVEAIAEPAFGDPGPVVRMPSAMLSSDHAGPLAPLSDPASHHPAVLVMAYYKGWCPQRIADHFGLTLGESRSRLRAELISLRKPAPQER